MTRRYIVQTWSDAASDEYSGEQVGRRRPGGDSLGLVWDKATDDVFPESDLYHPNGDANVALFSQNDRLKAFLQEAFKAAKKRRIDIDELDRLDETLERFRMLISDDDYAYLVNAFVGMRGASYKASLTPEQRKEVEAEDLNEFLLSLNLVERRDKFRHLCAEKGIPIAKDGRKPMDVDVWKVVKKIGELTILAILIIYIFYIA